MKQLNPTPLKQQYWSEVEKRIQKVFNKIYADLFELIRPETELYNSTSITSAIAKSKIYYVNGNFIGKFNSSLTKELREIGAVFDSKSKTWKLPESELPIHIQSSIVQKQAEMATMQNKAVAIIDSIDVNQIIDDSDIKKTYESSIQKMSNDIDKSIGIKVSITDKQREIIAKEWSDNLDLYIKKFTQENISQLREDVQKNVERGQRAENLVKSIQSRYNVTKSKAQFLARQETSLLMSKMRKTRYKDAGLQKYKWSTSHDERVRDMHRELDGKIYFWDSPPIVNNKGERAHPGEDFNCRCNAIPIIE